MYPKAVIIPSGQGAAQVLPRVELAAGDRNEAWLRDFLLRHPEALPAAEIDRQYADLVPMAAELSTPAGPIDAVFVTPQGGLAVIECKLWRNPQARREVVGQILDYAKELARWRYEDLQREVSRARRGLAAAALGACQDPPGGDLLFAAVSRLHPETHQASFIDAVSRNLAQGRFLLLIVGDGIREGTETIARFLADHGGLRFTLGLVEMAGYELPGGALLVQPRVLARTVQVERTVIRIRDIRQSGDIAVDAGAEVPEDQDEADPADVEDRQPRRLDPAMLAADKAFWERFAAGLQLDDPTQPPARRAGVGHARLQLAPGAHITVYRARTPQVVGVFVTMPTALFERVAGPEGSEQEAEIEREVRAALGETVELGWGGGAERASFGVRWPESFTPAAEADQRHLERLWPAANVFVNVFRPRVLRALEGG